MSYVQECKRYEGWVGDIAWFDEPPPEDVYVATLRGLQRHNGYVMLTMTPLDCAWIDRRYMRARELMPGVVAPALPEYVEASLESNVHIPEARKEHWRRAVSFSSEKERRARLEGKSIALMGVISAV